VPLVEPIQGIMVRTEVFRRGVASSRSIEHPAQRHAINDAAMHAKAHDATRALVHHDENPVCAQDDRFASKQIETREAVLRVTKDREPGRPRRVGFRRVSSGENAPRHILVDGNTEGQGDLLSDPWTTPLCGRPVTREYPADFRGEGLPLDVRAALAELAVHSVRSGRHRRPATVLAKDNSVSTADQREGSEEHDERSQHESMLSRRIHRGRRSDSGARQCVNFESVCFSGITTPFTKLQTRRRTA
jgi:hypothetical protein